jgi:hypothetical protein
MHLLIFEQIQEYDGSQFYLPTTGSWETNPRYTGTQIYVPGISLNLIVYDVQERN